MNYAKSSDPSTTVVESLPIPDKVKQYHLYIICNIFCNIETVTLTVVKALSILKQIN